MSLSFDQPLRRSLTYVFVVAVQALTHTITHLTKSGRFRQAADREKDIAQIYLQDINDLSKACESFERAGEWYSQEDATAYVGMFISVYHNTTDLTTYSTANACYKDAADLHADLENYARAIQLYEQVANGSLSSALTKYSVKEYWLRSSLCALAMNVSPTMKVMSLLVDKLVAIGHCHCQAQHGEVHLPGHDLCVDAGGQIHQYPH